MKFHLYILSFFCLTLPVFSFSQNQGNIDINDTTKHAEGYILWQDKTKTQLINRNGDILVNLPGNLCALMNNKQLIAAHVDGTLAVYNKDFDMQWKKPIFINHELTIDENNDIILYSERYDTINNMQVRFDLVERFDSSGNFKYQWDMNKDISQIFNFLVSNKAILYNTKNITNADSLLNYLAPKLNSITPSPYIKEFYHMNSIQCLPENPLEKKDSAFKKGNLLLSFCSYNDSLKTFMAIVNPINFNILWSYFPEKNIPVHTPNMIANGNILYYANSRCHVEADESYIAELDPVEKKIVWTYVENFPNTNNRCSHGSCQRLPNGNTFISNISGFIYEVSPEKEIVWQWHTASTKHLYRATWLPAEKISWLIPND